MTIEQDGRINGWSLSEVQCQPSTASILRSSHHSDRLHSAENAVPALNSSAKVDENVGTSMEVDALMLLHAVANDAADEFVLA